MKTRGMSCSQDQKERKTAITVTTIFFEQKITKAQICFSNDRLPSRIDEWKKMNTSRFFNYPHTVLENEKTCTTKKSHQG